MAKRAPTTVAATLVSVALDGMHAIGLDARKLAARASIPRKLSDDPWARVPYRAWVVLWEEALLASSPSCGLDVALATESHLVFDLPQLAARHAPTIREALQRLLRFKRILNDATHTTFEARGDALWLLDGAAEGEQAWPRALTDFVYASYVLLGRRWTSRALPLRELHLRHCDVDSRTDYARVFGLKPSLGADRDALVVDASVLAMPIVGADPLVAEHLEHRLDALIRARAPAHDVERMVRSIVEAGEAGRPIGVDDVATSLGTSARTLQRWLRDRGETFDGIADGARRRWVRERMHAGEPLVEIARATGFASSGSLRKALRRWDGATDARDEERLQCGDGALLDATRSAFSRVGIVLDERALDSRWMRLWDELADHAAPWIGLDIAAACAREPVAGLPILAARHAPTLGDALDRAMEAAQLSTGAWSMQRIDRANDVWLLHAPGSAEERWSRALVDFVYASILLLARRWSRTDFPVRGLLLRHRDATSLPRYASLLGIDPVLGCAEDALVVSRAALTLPIHGVDPHVQQHVVRHLSELPRRDPAAATIDEVRALLRTRVSAGGTIRAPEIADALGASVRTLQRRLAEVGATLESLVDDARRELVTHERMVGTPLEEIARVAGYGSLSALRRALRRWDVDRAR